jgi:hypothetical protein
MHADVEKCTQRRDSQEHRIYSVTDFVEITPPHQFFSVFLDAQVRSQFLRRVVWSMGEIK